MTTANRPDTNAAPARHTICSTYRMQFHKNFTFRDAIRITPYLHALGITDAYASPYLKATPGSTHGYDVIDHSRLNDEVGTEADRAAWVAALGERGMSHVLDIVPNHMGIATNENPVWNDTLENGTAGRYGHFFDIAWDESPRPEMHGKVLLATLGEPYADVLERGQLKIVLDADAGAFSVAYYDRRFPIAPETYERILARVNDDLPLPKDDPDAKECGGIVNAIRSLRPRHKTSTDQVATRVLEVQSIKSRLAALLKRSAPVRRVVEERVASMNGTPGQPRTFDALDELLNLQAYRLAFWQTTNGEINYRRFFDVNDLASLAIERQEVFDESHRRIVAWAADGSLSGLRVDHPDGLYDPEEYFHRLQSAYAAAVARGTGVEASGVEPVRVWGEKILAMDEPLVETWPIEGTSGYDFLVAVNGLFVEQANEAAITSIYTDFVGPDTPADYDELVYRNKLRILDEALASELNMLARRLDRLAQRDRRSRDFTFANLRAALREVVACFGVYRTYISDRGYTDQDAEQIERAIAAVKRRAPGVDAALLTFIRDTLLSVAPDARHFAGKFQQLTAPATAKGVEDTTFYQYHRLLSLNEVGGEPSKFGVGPDELHRIFAHRQQHWPLALSTLSTHDTKRSEDVRARISVLSEIPEQWKAEVNRWHDASGARAAGVHPADAYLFFQTVLGAWPLGEDAGEYAKFIDRVGAYMLKALKEGKQRTTWTKPDAAYEGAISNFVKATLDPQSKFVATAAPFVRRIARAGLVNSLAQTLIKYTAPGIPDTYQGTELWDFSLVDPDNRRPVDYGLRAQLLSALDETIDPGRRTDDVAADLTDGRAKLLVSAQSLRLRRELQELFSEGDYIPLTAAGPSAHRVFAFARRRKNACAVTIVPRLVAAASLAADRADGWRTHDWAGTRIDVGRAIGDPARLVDRLTGNPARATGTTLQVDDLLTRFPVALLATE